MSDLLDRLASLLTDSEIARIAELRPGSATPPPAPPTAPAPTAPKQITKANPDGYCVVEYASICPFNSDNSALLLIHEQGFFGLYYGTGQFYQIVPEINSSSRPRWHRTDPNLFTFFSGTQLKEFDIRTNQSRILHTFAGKADDGGEADLSEDGNCRIVTIDGQYALVYRFQQDSISTALPLPAGFDSAYLTPNNNVLIADQSSITLYDSNLKPIMAKNGQNKITNANGHHDTMHDLNGDEILIWCNSNDSSGRNKNAELATCPNGIIKVRLSDGHQSCLGSLNWDLSMDISGADPNSSYCLVSTYGDKALTGEILKVPLDGLGPIHLADHHSKPYNSYNWQPHAALGRLIPGKQTPYVFSTNMGIQQPGNLQYSEVWMGFI